MPASIRKAEVNRTAIPSLPERERVTPARKLVYNKEILPAHYGLGLSLPAARASMCPISRASYELCLVCR